MQEIVLIFVIALIVYGPKDLPELGRKVGRYLAMFKRMVNDVKRQMDSELYEHSDPIRKEMEKINREAMETIKPPMPPAHEHTAAEKTATKHPDVHAVNTAPPTDKTVTDGGVPDIKLDGKSDGK